MKGIPITLSGPPEHQGPLPGSASVVIIGGGVIGVMTAYFLARKGMRPVLVEKGRIAGEQSSRNWGWIRQMGRDHAELPIMIEANRLWHRLQSETNEDLGLRECGLTYVAQSPAQMASFESWLGAARDKGVDTRLLSAQEVSNLLPGAQGDWVGAMRTGSDMRAEPWVAVPSLARAAVRAGAVVVENCAARLIDTEAGRVSGVVTEAGRISAPEVVVAGGAWSRLLLRRHGIDIPQLSVRATVVATEPVKDVHSGGVDIGKLAFRRRADGGYTLAEGNYHELWVGPDAFRDISAYWPHLRASPFGRRYRIATPKGFPDAWSTPRRWEGDQTSPFERCRMLDPAPNMKKANDVLGRFSAMFRQLGKVRAKAAWAGMIDTLPDVVPVVDRADTVPGLSICTGMCGHGFGIGPAFGRIMADLVAGDPVGHDLARFRLSRFNDGSKLEIHDEL